MRITTQNITNIKPQLADFLSDLKVGDSVRGKIIELFGESISLKTASGQMFTAALMTDAELSPGQTIELIISDITQDEVFAELKSEQQKPVKITEDVKLQQVLKQLDIKPEGSNLQAAKLLIKYNMPITKDNILNLVSTQKSVETMAQGDVVNALSLLQSEQDINNTEFTKLVKQAVVLEEQGKQALSLIKQDIPDLHDAPKDKNIEQPKAIINNEVKQDLTAEVKATVEAGQKQVEKQPALESTPKQVLQQLVELIDTEEMQKSAPKIEKLIDTIVKAFETASLAKPEHSAYLISKDMDITPSTVKALVDNIGSKGKLGAQLEELEKLIEILEQDKVDVKELKQNIKRLFLRPEAVQDKELIQDTIKDIIKISSKLESLIREHGLEDKADKTILSDIKNNLDFSRNLNNINYIQIPLLINENKTTADIYVFSGKKRSKTINPENASILIALDLKDLGHIESLIGVSKRNVNVTFKVEKDEFKQLIISNGEGLKNALEARGYALNPIQVIDMHERFNLLELEEMTATPINKMHLDIKV